MPCKIKDRLRFLGRGLPRRTPVVRKLFWCVWLAALSLCGPCVQSRVGSTLVTPCRLPPSRGRTRMQEGWLSCSTIAR